AVLRGYSWYDIAGWEYNGYLWGTELSEIGRIRTLLRDFLLNRFRLFSYDPARIDQFLKKLSRSVYLEGYSSILYQLARYQNENNIKYRYNLKMIKATAEQLPDYQQHEITRAFGRKAISEYGSAEAGIIAFECPCGTKHINMEHVIVEEEDQEILVTNLLSYAFPIIRYRLGDMIILAESHACPCGMKHSALQEIIGRKGDIIIGKNNTYPSLLLYHIFKNLARKELLLDYQVIQKVPAEIEVFIFSGIDNRQEALLLKELVKNFGNDIDCRIRRGKTPVLINGKRVDFISEIEQRST
ncbi:MAG: phenylacetate--CoA ligase family protein, partial [Candidatus Cloacimonetes bacterium]|nr:phenylacetate--CoA ligase family protein [Candidatus Cloacimonadota bacterium]